MAKRFQHKATESISIESSYKSLRALRALCGKKLRSLMGRWRLIFTTKCTKITKGGKEKPFEFRTGCFAESIHFLYRHR
jgi:hypothetical protein